MSLILVPDGIFRSYGETQGDRNSHFQQLCFLTGNKIRKPKNTTILAAQFLVGGLPLYF
jgi:hypothetical protein